MSTTTTSIYELAVDGGEPVRATPVAGWPIFAEDEIAAVAEVLGSGRVSYWTGNHGRRFEREFAEHVGTAHAIAVANGTVALEAALHALGLERGSEVIVPAATFIATASAVVRSGCRPVVADVGRDSQCLTAETLQRVITPRTRAVVVVHLGGSPANMVAILNVARSYGLRVVEDCAQALGARWDGRSVGTFGDVAAWSFCQDKILTTAGEGGAVTTGDDALWRRCWELRDHGKSYDAVFGEHPPGFRWLHESFGTNLRMSEVQAAVGRHQLRKLDGWVARRRRSADALAAGLADLPALRLPAVSARAHHVYYRFYAHVREELLAPGWNRDQVVEAINAEGVPCAHGSCFEIYRERAFGTAGYPQTSLPVAAELHRTTLVLFVHPSLGDVEIADTVTAVRKVMAQATAPVVPASKECTT